MNIDPEMVSYNPYDDSKLVAVEGNRYRVEFENDHDSTPFDAECYSESDVRAWRNDDWYYITVVVTPLDVPENVQSMLEDSLSGLEFDFPLSEAQEHEGRVYSRTDERYQLLVYPVPDMIDGVAMAVAKWKESIGRLAGIPNVPVY